MPQTEAQKAWRKAKRKEGGQPHVRIDTTPATKAEWKAYAEYKGMPLGTLIRQCLTESMERDGWVYQPEEAEEQ